MQCFHELDKKSGWFNFPPNGVLEKLADFLEHGILSGLDLISVKLPFNFWEKI